MKFARYRISWLGDVLKSSSAETAREALRIYNQCLAAGMLNIAIFEGDFPITLVELHSAVQKEETVN
jgi:hypothetical protein